MTADARSIAQQIGQAFEKGLEAGLAAPGLFLADQVMLQHEPPQESDGPREGADLAAEWADEGRKLKSVMPDARVEDLVITTPNPSLFVIRARMCGTTGDGQAVDQTFTVEYEVSKGKVSRVVTIFTASESSAIILDTFE